MDVEGSIDLAMKAFDGDAVKIEKVRKLLDTCANATDSDRCEAAVKIYECGHNAAKTLGVSFEDI